MFRTSQPVTAGDFLDREGEMARLDALVNELSKGRPSWVALVGPRKVGKTSLVLELARRRSARTPRSRREDVAFVVIDAQDSLPLSNEIFRRYALRALDVLLGRELGVSLEVLASHPRELSATLAGAEVFRRLSSDVRTQLLSIADRPANEAMVRDCLQLPEVLARALGRYVVIAFDEFQELAELGGRRHGADPLPLVRSVWQRHERVAYVVSGSGRSMLEQMVSSSSSPFFQHFGLMRIGPFDEAHAIELLVRQSPPGRRIPTPVARAAARVLGGHPFYLQLLGATLVSLEPPYDESSLKVALQDVLFSRSGRLSLYFENELSRLVGRSSFLAAGLEALAAGPLRLTEIATRIGTKSGDTVRYLERLGDAVVRRDDGTYALDDPTFGLWLRWRKPGGSAVPMTVVGDEAERRTAEHLARMGFDLVYQSRASRGAFDLLALRGATQLGVQVKRSPLPLRFAKSAWNRMVADAKRLGWRWVVAAVDADGSVSMLDPAHARVAREVRLDADATIENLLLWT